MTQNRPDPAQTADADTLPGFGPRALREAMKALGESPDAEVVDLSGTEIGRYRVLRRLGAGGFGVVYEAEQLRPVTRRVALKVSASGSMSAAAARRLLDEQQTLAVIQDPAIVTLLDTGTIPPAVVGGSGTPYLVMQLVEGVPITRYADERELGLKERIELMAEAARGVAAAHRHGVIHRDLKPDHMLVEESGQVRLIDFGVARAEHADRMSQTQSGQMIGTPRYMSPEQRAGRVGAIDTRSDVYALGMVLAELVIGPSLTDLDPATVARTPTSELLPHDRAHLRRRCRRDVDWIVAKALADGPGDRYGSAAEFGADLLRAARSQPVEARPKSVWLPLVSFARRRPAAVAAIAVLLVVVPVALAIVTSLWIQNAALAKDAVREAANAKSESRVAHLAAAQASIAAGTISTAREQLLAVPKHDRDWTWRHLALQAFPQGRLLLHVPVEGDGRDPGKFQALALAPGGRCFVGDAAGGLWLLDSARGSILDQSSMPDQVFCAAFSPRTEGPLAVGCADRALSLFDPSGFDEMVARVELPAPPISLAFDSTGHWLAVGMVETRAVMVLDAATQKIVRSIPLESAGCFAVRFAPDTGLLYIGTAEGSIEVWEVTSGAKLSSTTVDEGRIQDISFVPDGSRIVAAGFSGRISLLGVGDDGTLTPIARAQQAAALTACPMDLSGQAVYSGGADGAVRRWTLPDLRMDAAWHQHGEQIYGTEVDPDTGEIVSCALDGAVRAIALGQCPPAIERRPLVDADTAWDTDVRFALVRIGSELTIVDSISGQRRQLAHPRIEHLKSYHISTRGEVGCNDLETGEISLLYPDGTVAELGLLDRDRLRTPHNTSMLQSDSRIVSVGSEEVIVYRPGDRIFGKNHATGVERTVSAVPEIVSSVSVKGLADGRWVFCGGEGVRLLAVDGSVRRLRWDGESRGPMSLRGDFLLWETRIPMGFVAYDLAADRVHATIPPNHRAAHAASITPDGRTIAVAQEDGSVHLYDAATARLLLSLPGSDPPQMMSFDEDDTLRFGSSRGAVRLWRAAPSSDIERE